VISPKKAVAYQLARDLHSSGLVKDPEFMRVRLEQLDRHDKKLGSFVKSELQAYGDTL
jgi:hypothetical protein